MGFKPVIFDTTESANVFFADQDTGKVFGYGYIAKKDNPDKKICLVKCPSCNKENYAMAVVSGVCSWCGFDSNEI